MTRARTPSVVRTHRFSHRDANDRVRPGWRSVRCRLPSERAEPSLLGLTVGVDDALAVADRFFAAIESGDLDTVRSIYSPDVAVWHNTDGVTEDRERNLRVLGWLVRSTTARRYEEIVRSATDAGFAQRHVLRLELHDGRSLAIPAAVFADVTDGRITAIHEYLDATAVAPLVEATAPR